MSRKICAVTGSRAEYSILRPVLRAIENSPDLILSVVVTGTHLSPFLGNTIQNIESDGFTIGSRVEMILDSDRGIAMSKAVGIGIMGIAQSFEHINPDIVLIAGDRIEAFAAAIAATYMNLPIAHIHGGDLSIGGHVDDIIRHTISKMAHLHFTASLDSANRLKKMGESPDNVFIVGAPALDSILGEKEISSSIISIKYGIDITRPFLIVLQNPVTREWEEAGFQMKETMDAIVELEIPTIVIYPNSDTGGLSMIRVIQTYTQPNIIKIPNVPHLDYITLLRNAGALVGNSSGGLIECPSLGLPVVNIGKRQKGRERAENVIDVPHDKKKIKEAIIKALYNNSFIKKSRNSKKTFGDGTAGIKIADILKNVKIDENLLQKKITY